MHSIGLIGPVLPLRGGIAQHTTMLHRSLSRIARLNTVSFKRSYPLWLYPGASNIEPGYEGHTEKGVAFIIDSLNPLSWEKGYRHIISNNPEAVVFAWWTIFWAPCYLYMARRLKSRGIRVIFLCHNVQDHEHSGWKTFLGKHVLSYGDAFLVHASSEVERLKLLVPDAAVKIHSHPLYEHFPSPAGKLKHRAKLELLFFGFVRDYKGLDVLLDAMDKLPSQDVWLTIAGEWWTQANGLRQRAAAMANVELIDRYIPEDEASELFSRADAVILPYKTASGSGVVPLAYRYCRPVITTRVGGLPDVVEDGKTGRLVAPGDPGALARAIEGFPYHAEHVAEALSRAASLMTWDSLAKAVVELAAGPEAQ